MQAVLTDGRAWGTVGPVQHFQPFALDLSGLNPVQYEAATCPPGPVLVFAGAGSGKTRCLTSRIAWLLAQGEDPRGILAITFTNKAAREMKERLGRLLGLSPDDPEGPIARMRMGTFHSQFMRLMRAEDLSDFGLTNSFSIYDEDDRERLIKKVLADMAMGDLKPGGVVNAISAYKNQGMMPEQALASAEDASSARMAHIYALYQERLAANDAADFDDLLLIPMLFFGQLAVRQKWATRFRHILVDEFQDTNAVQLELLRQLSSVHGSLWAVGDDSQSIYSWRGAQIENILRFAELFPGARTFTLDQNYRSVQCVLDAANNVIANNSRGVAKKLWSGHGAGHGVVFKRLLDEENEAAFITKEAHRLHGDLGIEYSEMAVLLRTNAQTRAIEARLTRAGIPYRIIGGVKFWGRKEVKDLVAWLRTIVSVRDGVAWRRALLTPSRGIGAATADKIADYAAANGNDWDGALEAALNGSVGPLRATGRERLTQFALLRRSWAGEQGTIEPVALVRRVLENSHLAEANDDGTELGARRVENLGEVVNAAAGYGPGELSRMLEEVALSSEADNDAGSALSLMTLHAAKGLEFSVVFLAGAEDNLLPMSNSDDIEEERRLFYVGITRAQRQLYISAAAKRSMWGRTQPQSVSPFVREIPRNLLTGLPPRQI